MNTLKNIITDFGTKPFAEWEREHGPTIAWWAVVAIIGWLIYNQ